MQWKLLMRSLLLIRNLLYFVIWSWNKSGKSVSFYLQRDLFLPLVLACTPLHPGQLTPQSPTPTPQGSRPIPSKEFVLKGVYDLTLV